MQAPFQIGRHIVRYSSRLHRFIVDGQYVLDTQQQAIELCQQLRAVDGWKGEVIRESDDEPEEDRETD